MLLLQECSDERINGSSGLMERGGPNPEPTERTQLYPSWEESLQWGGRDVFHVLNVAMLISFTISGNDLDVTDQVSETGGLFP